jgi:hypothetical protein
VVIIQTELEGTTMKTTTMKQLIDNTNIPAVLVRAVVRQSGGWESFAEMAPDIANHGIDGGFSGWISYSDTHAFWKRNRVAIMGMAEEQAKDFGVGVLEMIQNFGVFRNDPITIDSLARALYQGKGDSVTTVQNVMAWYAAEEVARVYRDLLEE